MNAVLAFLPRNVGEEFVEAFSDPGLLLGIPLALAGAVFMSLGAQYQHRGVTKVEKLSGAAATTGLSLRQVGSLLARPSWVIGTLMLGLAILCQLSALWVAPLIVVQPLGAMALVITTLLNARVSGHTPTRRSLIAITACVGGIFLFVIFAAIYAVVRPVTNEQLYMILIILFLVTVILLGCWLLLRNRMRALFYVTAAGILYGFVATLAKVVMRRIQEGQFDFLTILCIFFLIVAAVAGAYFVQTAYSSGPPDLVIAGLTVVDPLVAVLIGMLVLGEAAHAPSWAQIVFLAAGAIAVWGVIGLARYHPQILSESQELGIERGSSGGALPGDAAPAATAKGSLTPGPWPGSPASDPDPPPRSGTDDAP